MLTRFAENLKRRRHGHVLLITVIIMMILSLQIGSILRGVERLLSASNLAKDQLLADQMLSALADKVRGEFLKKIDESGGLYPGAPKARNLMEADIVNWMSNFVADVQAHLPEKQSVRVNLTCLHQLAGSTKENCTMQRVVVPKFFQLEITRLDAKTGMLSRSIQEFKIERATINQFAYLITGAEKNVNFGNVKFDGPVGVFFSIPSLAAGNSINFSGDSPGSVFNGPLLTNLTGVQGLKFEESAKAELGIVSFNNPLDIQNNIITNYLSLVADAQAAHPTTITEASLMTQCQAADTSTNCSVSVFGTIEISSGNSCTVKVTQKGSWTDSLNPGNIGNSNEVIYNGAQTSGGIYYIKGQATISAPAGASTARVCAKQSFIADSMIVQNSIEKANDQSNTALLSSGRISLAAPSAMVLRNGTAAGVKLSTLKATPACGLSLDDDEVGLLLETSIISVGDSFYIPPTFYDNNPDNFSGICPVRLGHLTIKGLLVTKNTFSTSREWQFPNYVYRMSGFTKANLDQDSNIVTSPPPGVGYQVDKGLKQKTVSISTTKTSIEDAIAQIEN